MRPHAELARVWPRDGRLRLIGSLHGHDPVAGAAAPWALLLVARRAPERVLAYPAPLAGAAFDVSLPVADLAPGGIELPAVWDLFLSQEVTGRHTGRDGAPQGRLRVGRLLDDIEDKKKIMVFPGQPVATGAGPVLVKPYYTVKDNLSVEVAPAS
ncbi:hypothetical protein [Streptomyces marincola]|uniref:Uncharacterized protein n=1 Tax=Streptomyces marincola TaxID=2878388 RepID=A0A1W7D6C2_9ACTN|nr:hypothetical protein [Streptomyces marincola]ARQ72618.1 hypothetical protein CAG99_24510 [Streptomyces marincola]